MFEVGDLVMVKHFDDLVAEFATEEEIEAMSNDEIGGFDCDQYLYFNFDMKGYCGNEYVITKREDRANGPIYSLQSCGEWVFSPGMLVDVSECQIEESDELNAFLDEWA